MQLDVRGVVANNITVNENTTLGINGNITGYGYLDMSTGTVNITSGSFNNFTILGCAIDPTALIPPSVSINCMVVLPASEIFALIPRPYLGNKIPVLQMALAAGFVGEGMRSGQEAITGQSCSRR